MSSDDSNSDSGSDNDQSDDSSQLSSAPNSSYDTQAANVDPKIIEASPEYDLTRLLVLARLLTSYPGFRIVDMNAIRQMIDLPTAPSCESGEGPYVTLLNQLSSMTYPGDNPINDLVMTLRQLASCQASTQRGLFKHISDFFMSRDGGAALRGLLLLSKVIIEILSLWYVMKLAGMIGDSGSVSFQEMQAFSQSALTTHDLSMVEIATVPSAIRDLVQTAQSQWDDDDTTIVATFSLSDDFPQPVLLPFVPEALSLAMQDLETKGDLPEQQSQDSEPDGSRISPGQVLSDEDRSNIVQGTAQIRAFISALLGSGAVKPADSSTVSTSTR